MDEARHAAIHAELRALEVSIIAARAAIERAVERQTALHREFLASAARGDRVTLERVRGELRDAQAAGRRATVELTKLAARAATLVGHSTFGMHRWPFVEP